MRKVTKRCKRYGVTSVLAPVRFRFFVLMSVMLVLCVCVVGSNAFAQNSVRPGGPIPIWRPVPRCPVCWPHPPIIEVPQINRDEIAIEVGEYDVDAQVDGMYARVITEFTVINKNSRIFEGELEFPLPDGAAITGYAIDLNGAMVPASVVEKEKARIAFEAEVKLGADPGFVEQIRGNAYRTRIYPIPAKGYRRIRVEYVAPLALSPAGDAALALPMPRTKLSKRDVKISVNIPGISEPALSGLGDDRFKAAKAYWVAESHERDIAPGDDILVAMPVLQQNIAVIENTDGDHYFLASVQIPVQPAADVKLPSAFRILWDASGSRKPGDIQVSRDVLERLPEKASYELHVFRNTLEPVKTFNKRDELIAYIDSLAYDGGTDFEPLVKLASQKFSGMTLFFTDGLDTYTNALPQFGSNAVALISGAQHDTPVMRRICGGRVLDISILDPADILKQIADQAPVISEVNGKNIGNIQGIGMPAIGRISVLGRLLGAPGKISIVLSNGAKLDVDLSRAAKSTGRTIASAWAALRVEELSPDAENHRDELLAIGRHFSIVSPVSSMIVFERIDQWLKYNIEPPESLADMHRRWEELRMTEAEQKADQKEKQDDWLAELKKNWLARVSWWEHKQIKRKYKKMKDCYEGECEIYYVDQFGNEYMADEHGKIIIDRDLDDLDWSEFEAGSYGIGVTGSGMGAGGGAGMGGFGGGGFGPGGAPPSVGRSAYREAPAASRAPVVQGSRGRPQMKMLDGGGGYAPAREARMSLNSMKAASVDYKSDTSDYRNADASIVIQAWDANTPYLTAIRDAQKVFKDKDSMYREYLKWRDKYKDSPAFFLDCANLFITEKQTELGIRILSNLAELKLDDVALLRVYAWRLREAGQYDHAITILRKVLKLRSDEAVSWRDLALTLTMRAKKTKRSEDVQEALECYHKAAFTAWDRTDAMWTALVALEEFNALVAWSKRQSLSGKSVSVPKMDPVFNKLLDTDLRIVMMWDSDNTDIDLHVIEPSGEEVFYENKRSANRGLLSFDVTDGYGPEEYLIKKAPKGVYKARTNYYSSHEQKLVGPATITAIVYTNWGRAGENSNITSIRLGNEKETIDIAEVNIK